MRERSSRNRPRTRRRPRPRRPSSFPEQVCSNAWRLPSTRHCKPAPGRISLFEDEDDDEDEND
jgi:hypothetical protein